LHKAANPSLTNRSFKTQT